MDASRKAIIARAISEYRKLQNEFALHLKDLEDDDRKQRKYVNVSACLIVENINSLDALGTRLESRSRNAPRPVD